MDERTEGLALSRVLPLLVGGQTVQLRTLSIDESDAWLGLVAARLASVDLDQTLAASESIAELMTWSSSAVVGLVAAYDLDGTLGGIEAIRSTMSKGELKAAMDAMVTAEDPFGEAVARSVVETLGLPSRFLATFTRMEVTRAIASQLASSTTGPSAPTDSTIGPSEPVGVASSSTSDGRTRNAKRRSA